MPKLSPKNLLQHMTHVYQEATALATEGAADALAQEQVVPRTLCKYIQVLVS